MKFWDQTHELYSDYEKLYDELVPISGSCDTKAGELLRAASRINHDHYNNGSCNNVTGAWHYLNTVGYAMLYTLEFGDEYISRFNEALAIVEPYMNCNAPIVTFDESNVNEAMDTLAEIATRIAFADSYEPASRLPNTTDMLDLQDPNIYEDAESYFPEDYWMGGDGGECYK